jgi:hypothetical protein
MYHVTTELIGQHHNGEPHQYKRKRDVPLHGRITSTFLLTDTPDSVSLIFFYTQLEGLTQKEGYSS